MLMPQYGADGPLDTALMGFEMAFEWVLARDYFERQGLNDQKDAEAARAKNQTAF